MIFARTVIVKGVLRLTKFAQYFQLASWFFAVFIVCRSSCATVFEISLSFTMYLSIAIEYSKPLAPFASPFLQYPNRELPPHSKKKTERDTGTPEVIRRAAHSFIKFSTCGETLKAYIIANNILR